METIYDQRVKDEHTFLTFANVRTIIRASVSSRNAQSQRHSAAAAKLEVREAALRRESYAIAIFVTPTSDGSGCAAV